VFMVVAYKFFGLLANVALVVNVVLLVAVMSVLGATLTMPGIAGIVLTMGMAVDSNIIIFARIKEELKNRGIQGAIDAGFDRAFLTIFDANLTTFFIAVILFAMGSGPVKGFAVTLAIGIVTTVFTAVTVTRAFVNLTHGGRNVKKLYI
jgi:preprotein translocase subunit SecD